MTARVIRVDWDAWAASEARARAVCGSSAFVLGALVRPGPTRAELASR